MTNLARSENNQRKKEQKAAHKASHKLRKLKKTRHGVWVTSD